MIHHTYQPPAMGILKSYDYGDLIAYHVPCSCMNDDDAIDMTIEIDEGGEITVSTDIKPKSAYWRNLIRSNSTCANSLLWNIDTWCRYFINGLYHRLNITYDVWVNGYVQYYHNIIMNKQQAFNYAETIKQAIIDVQRFKELKDELSRKNEQNNGGLGEESDSTCN